VRRRRGQPRGRGLVGGGRGLGVEQQHPDLDRGDPVDHAVVGLADEPDRAVLEVGRDPHLPQRAVAPQRLGEHRVGEVLEVLGGGAVDVLGGVELLGVDPQRRVEAERVGGDPLAVARRPVEAAGDVREQLVEAGALGARGRLERRGPADVHVCAGALDGEEGGVEGRQALGRHALRH
jgi:hypothetical protein